jgi:hypothetical protein
MQGLSGKAGCLGLPYNQPAASSCRAPPTSTHVYVTARVQPGPSSTPPLSSPMSLPCHTAHVRHCEHACSSTKAS